MIHHWLQKMRLQNLFLMLFINKRTVIKYSLLAFAALLFWSTTQAQEIQSKVTILTQALPTSVNKQRFTTLATQLTNFINNRSWTKDKFNPQEKIECNFLINLSLDNSLPDQDIFGGTITVQSARPVFNSSYKAPVINWQDPDLYFKYVEFQPVEFNENRVAGNDPLTANLTAVIAYYVYMILGFDYDSFAPKGGNPYFVEAQNIVNNAPETRGISGWKVFDGQRNRYWLANNMVNTRFNIINDIIYTYYRDGLDKMYDDAVTARQNMIGALTQLQTFNRENPNTMILQFFVQSKYSELVGVFKKATPDIRGRAMNILSQIDPANADKYRADLK